MIILVYHIISEYFFIFFLVPSWTTLGMPAGYDRVRHVEVGDKNIKVGVFEDMFSSHIWKWPKNKDGVRVNTIINCPRGLVAE